jgi:hypothetical protein
MGLLQLGALPLVSIRFAVGYACGRSYATGDLSGRLATEIRGKPGHVPLGRGPKPCALLLIEEHRFQRRRKSRRRRDKRAARLLDEFSSVWIAHDVETATADEFAKRLNE